MLYLVNYYILKNALRMRRGVGKLGQSLDLYFFLTEY